MASINSVHIADHLTITQLLNIIKYAEDTLDWKLFVSCCASTQPLTIDFSSHLPEFPADMKMSAADYARTVHLQLSGFDSTQHILSNYMIDINEDGTKARAKTYVSAYHEFKRPVEQGPDFVLVRGLQVVNCIKEADGKWRMAGFKPVRMSKMDGDEKLYEIARAKGESSNGRPALTLWQE